ncbi:hypothetical protein [Aquimarina sp. 2201CG5-10]|uniref:hypothetical protein n=1 Tax=Aquimarina callyspongiae TaxID=3098150 RepID=UPI002AB50F9B|nr:hypothetical protein [Aquimarina sp. 2201CG5-10]MDY8135457.1 hypothetical protein [Aquimarina sp. 2201CG5-10]
MRYKIIFLLLLITSSIYGQVQKKFFVKDVESLEYVTVKFCVDNEAKISEVTIVEESTTYKNDYNIEQLRQYLLGIQYYEDSKLKNNCYNSTFEFINEKYEKKHLNEVECKACEKFKSGLYRYKHVLYRDTKIKRKRKIQREIGKEDKQIYFIKWLNNCTYILTYKRMSEQRLKHLLGKEIHVEIIDVLDNGDYLYRSKANFEDKVDYGVIRPVK